MKYSFLYFLFFLPCVLFSQSIINLGLLSQDQHFIKQASDSAVVLLKQEFVLYDSNENKDYTINNMAYFNKAYAMGIYSDSLIWTDSRLFQPWLNDTSVDFYCQKLGLIPRLSKLYYRNVYATEFKELDYEFYHTKSYNDSLLLKNGITLLCPQQGDFKQLSCERNTVNASGWIIAYYPNMPLKECDTCKISYAIFKAVPDFDNNAQLEKQPELSNIIGGFYLVPEIKTGEIIFRAAGYFRKLLYWYVKVFPEWDDISIRNTEPLLTPIKNTEKKRKRKK